MNSRQQLLQVFRETRALLALPSNDFNWSTWENADAALRELDEFISHVEYGRRFEGSGLSLLFAPTGDIQEVSLSSGWDHFCRVAESFDAAFEQYQKTPNV